MDFTIFEKKIIEAIGECKGAIKSCGKHSIQHLEKAWAIRELDAEMAVFRGITAEEEAASALFYCLKQHKYKNSSKIAFREHKHKLGLFPFIQGAGKFLGQFLLQDSFPFDRFQIHYTEKNGRKGLELHLLMRNGDYTAQPIPPLHFTISDPKTGMVCTFERSFQELITGDGYDDTLKYLKDIANTRNKLIYADEAGMPKFSGDINGYLVWQKKKVMLFLQIILMIDPWEKTEGSSLFVQQALDAFLLMLDRISTDEIHQPKKPHL